MWEKIAVVLRKMRNRPRHIRVSTIGETFEDCVRKLEKIAGLPSGDLYVYSEPMEVASWPVYKTFLKRFLHSKTSDAQKIRGKDGYIYGDVLEATGNAKLSGEEQSRLSLLAKNAIAIADSVQYFGNLHIAKNCPGIYSENRCTSCGDISR